MDILVRKTDQWANRYGNYRVDDEAIHYFNKISEVVSYVDSFLEDNLDEFSTVLVGSGIPIKESEFLRAISFTHNYKVRAPLLITPLKDFTGCSMVRVKGDIHGGMPIRNRLIPLLEGSNNKNLWERVEEIIISGAVKVDPWGRIYLESKPQSL